MRSLALIIIVSLVAQGRCSLLEDLEREVKEGMEKEVKAVVEPLMAEARHLRERVLEMKAHTMGLELASLGDMDYTACARLAETIEQAAQSAWNATLTGYSLAQNVSNTVWGLINCPGLNPFKTTECFYDDLRDIKNELYQAKPLVLLIKKELHEAIITVEEQYMECVGKTTAAPETAATETAAPDTAAPDTAAPQTAAPQTAAPETAAPETAAPQTSAPQTAAPRRVTTTKKSWWPFG